MTQQSETFQNETAPPDIVSGEDMPFDSASEKDLPDGNSSHLAKDASLSMEKPAKDLRL